MSKMKQVAHFSQSKKEQAAQFFREKLLLPKLGGWVSSVHVADAENTLSVSPLAVDVSPSMWHSRLQA